MILITSRASYDVKESEKINPAPNDQLNIFPSSDNKCNQSIFSVTEQTRLNYVAPDYIREKLIGASNLEKEDGRFNFPETL